MPDQGRQASFGLFLTVYLSLEVELLGSGRNRMANRLAHRLAQSLGNADRFFARVEHLFQRAVGDDAAVRQDRDAVGDAARLAQEVGGENEEMRRSFRDLAFAFGLAASSFFPVLLLGVFVLVNVSVLVLRRRPVAREHFRAPTALPVLGAVTCAVLAIHQCRRTPSSGSVIR